MLIVSPDSDWRSGKCTELAAEGFAVRATNCTRKAWRIFEAEEIAAVFLDEAGSSVGDATDGATDRTLDSFSELAFDQSGAA